MDLLKNKIFVSIILFFTLIIVLTGLYNLNNAEKTSGWNYEQLTLFSHLETNYTFTYSGDERDDEGNFKRMVNDLNINHPHILFSINGGDIRSEAVQLIDFKTDYLTPGRVAKFNKPVIFLTGNHELSGDHDGLIYQSIFGSPRYYNFTEKNSYFIIIDNAEGYLNETQMTWLKDQLNRGQNYKYRFVFMHKPLYTPSSAGEEHCMESNGTGGADALRSLFDNNNVTMIFASHIHNYYNGTWGITPFIISGGAGSPAEPNHPPNYHYIVVNVTDMGVNYTIVHY
jgi:hypothetical protein